MEATPSIIGAIGGNTANTGQPYLAFVQADGTLIEVSLTNDLQGVIPNFQLGIVASLALQSDGSGIAAGFAGTMPSHYLFGTQFAEDGSFSLIPTGNYIYPADLTTVTINDQGWGLIGGGDGSLPPYLSLFSPSGNLVAPSSFPVDYPTVGLIVSAKINANNLGLIGGKDTSGGGQGTGYAAFITPQGNVQAIPGLASAVSTYGLIAIRSIGLNDSGYGLIAGGSVPAGFAAQVTYGGGINVLTSPNFPAGNNGFVNVCDVNNNNLGIIGGYTTGNGPAYLGYVNFNGTITEVPQIAVDLSAGSIDSVSLNNAGVALVGGSEVVNPPGGAAYAALVYPDGTVLRLPISGLIPDGDVNATALSDSGVGLIGAIDNSGTIPLAAFIVAPNGTLTQLGLTASQVPTNINSVAVINSITPETVSSFSGAMNLQLTVNYALESHMITRTRLLPRTKEGVSTALLADAGDFRIVSDGKESSTANVWFAPFGNFIHQTAYQGNPHFTNQIGGMIAAFDMMCGNFLWGAGGGYGYNYFQLGQGLGHGNVQEELLFTYGSYEEKNFWIHGALWGGIFQFHNKRFTLSSIPSIGVAKGWLFSPRIECAAPLEMFKRQNFSLEPFFSFDWVNGWQGNFTESGSSGLNLIVPSTYVSLLRSEVGSRLYQMFSCKAGSLGLEEKLSYVNQMPFHFDPVTVSFVASPSSFPITIGSPQIQNLVGAQLHGTFSSHNEKYPYVALDFQGEWGPYYQSYFIGLEIGKVF